MIFFIVFITVFCLAVPAYVYAGYPLLLIILSKVVPARAIDRRDITPRVSMIISCYNEVEVIEKKIHNCLDLRYSKDNIEFIFVSDGSDDGTDEIINAYLDDRIKLVRQEGRLGKTSGLNLAMPSVSGEIVVFSDANAMYQADAIEKLVRNFHDPGIGYVVGAALYTDRDASAAAENESSYWDYEIYIKKMESSLHSVVGGDGAIYAIRKALYEPLDAKDINDFVNPLQIIAKGYRGVFDEQARCYEETAGSFEKEGARKERIVNRSIRGLMKVRQVMNPFKTGLFSLQVISHKLLRWLVPYFLIVAALGSVYLSAQDIHLFQFVVAAMILFFSLALIGYMNSENGRASMLVTIPYYFILVNVFSMKGVWRYLLGETQVTWNSARAAGVAGQGSGKAKIAMFSLIVIAVLAIRLYLDLFT